jgi:flagellar motor switch protein FliN/FliY
MDDRSDIDVPEDDPFALDDEPLAVQSDAPDLEVEGDLAGAATEPQVIASDETLEQGTHPASDEDEEDEEPFEQIEEVIVESYGPTIGDLDALRHVNLEVVVELGKTKMSVEQVTALQSGAVVPLDKTAGQALNLVIGDHVVASGEVVVIDGDNYAIRITEIHSPAIAQAGLLDS